MIVVHSLLVSDLSCTVIYTPVSRVLACVRSVNNAVVADMGPYLWLGGYGYRIVALVSTKII